MSDPTFADILATIPHNLGEVPKDCMALILVHDGSIVANMVFVIPDRDLRPEDAALIMSKLSNVEFEYFLCVTYTDRPSKCEEHPPSWHESQLMTLFLELFAGKKNLGAGLVTSEHFIDFSDDELTKHPLSEIAESPTALHLAVEHSHERPGMRLTVPEPDLSTPKLKQAVAAFTEQQPEMENFHDLMRSPHLSKARALWQTVIARDFGPTYPEAVDLIGYFQIDGLRDRMVVDVLSHTDDEATFVQILKGKYDIHFSRERIEHAISVLLNLCQYAAGKQRVGLLMGLAVLSYYKGNNRNALDMLELIPRKHRDSEWEWHDANLRSGGMSQSALNTPMP